MRRVLLLFGCLIGMLGAADSGWIAMFDGSTLEGWKANERPENWKVENGAIVGRGDRSHLFWMKQECTDCEFRAKVMINKNGNSGMFFRTQMAGPGFPRGYEAQVNNTHRDPVKTGSLYNIVKVYVNKAQDDTWFEEHILVRGNHIVIKVNGETVVDYIDDKNTHTKGYLALQQHDPGSVVMYKDLQFRNLAASR